MFEYQDFHESYFPHNCKIISESDVLETDIIGSGCIPCLKRWWHNLFLLSYTSSRTKRFYTSSHAMAIERFRQFRKYKDRIHPMSKFRIFWDTLFMYVIFINKIVFRFNSSFYFDGIPMVFFGLGAFLELIVIADFMINLKTGYIDYNAKHVILDTRKSLIRYCSHKLFLHLASAMPLHWLMFLRYRRDITCGLCKANRFISALKIISIFSLYRVFETTGTFIQGRPWQNRHWFKFLRIAVVGFISMLQFYDLCETIILLAMIENDEVAPTSLMSNRLIRIYQPGAKPPLIKLVFFELSRGFKSFLLFSFGVVKKPFYMDKLVGLTAYLVAHGFYIWVVMECYAFVSRKLYPKDRMEKISHGAENMITCRRLPDELRLKLDQYFKYTPTQLNLTEIENSLYRSLPPVLKDEIKLTSYTKYLTKIPFFSHLEMSIIERLVLTLTKEIFLHNDIVVAAWQPAEGLMLVEHGVLAVYSHLHKETGHLIDGDYFGELSLVTDHEVCLSNVVAISACTILVLPKVAFRNILRGYPEYFLEIKEQMKLRFNNPLESKRTSDHPYDAEKDQNVPDTNTPEP